MTKAARVLVWKRLVATSTCYAAWENVVAEYNVSVSIILHVDPDDDDMLA